MQGQDSTPWSVRHYHGQLVGRAGRATWRTVWALSRGALTVGIIGAAVAAISSWFLLPWLLGWPASTDAVGRSALAAASTLVAVAVLVAVLFVIQLVRAPVLMRNELAASTAAALGASASERDQAIAQQQADAEARPLLKADTYTMHITDERGRTNRWEARLRITNERPAVMVSDLYARIVAWGAVPDVPQPPSIFGAGGAPHGHVGALVRVDGHEGDVQGETDLVVATVTGGHLVAYFGVRNDLRFNHELTSGVWAVRVEVGARNLGAPPLSRWLRLDLVRDGGELQPTIELLDPA